MTPVAKISSLIPVTALLMFSASALADGDDGGPRIVPAAVDNVFVPHGFDDNDNVEVIIHGHFRNTCFKVGPSTAVLDAATHTITVQPLAYQYDGVCAQMMVPYIQSVSLGLVAEGDYQVVVAGQPDAQTTGLDVVRAPSRNPDDYLYAPVDHAALGTDGVGHDTVTLSGTFPRLFIGCMVLREVRVTRTPGNVLVVQPIAEAVEGDECDPSRYTYKFATTTVLPGQLAEGEYLLHVRVLAASSINRLAMVER